MPSSAELKEPLLLPLLQAEYTLSQSLKAPCLIHLDLHPEMQREPQGQGWLTGKLFVTVLKTQDKQLSFWVEGHQRMGQNGVSGRPHPRGETLNWPPVGPLLRA